MIKQRFKQSAIDGTSGLKKKRSLAGASARRCYLRGGYMYHTIFCSVGLVTKGIWGTK